MAFWDYTNYRERNGGATASLAVVCVCVAMDELADRRGFKGFWDPIDDEIKDEILAALEEKYQREIDEEFQGTGLVR